MRDCTKWSVLKDYYVPNMPGNIIHQHCSECYLHYFVNELYTCTCITIPEVGGLFVELGVVSTDNEVIGLSLTGELIDVGFIYGDIGSAFTLCIFASYISSYGVLIDHTYSFQHSIHGVCRFKVADC